MKKKSFVRLAILFCSISLLSAAISFTFFRIRRLLSEISSPRHRYASASEDNNLAIIHLPSGATFHIPINPYDAFSSDETEQEDLKHIYNTLGDNGSLHLTVNRTRGYANATITYSSAKQTEAADSLNIMHPFAILNCKTNDLRQLTSELVSFLSDDYYISQSVDSWPEADSQFYRIQLLIFFCPERC